MSIDCPVCDSVSLRSQRDPVTRLEIDICPRCHGLWFDARELSRFLQSELLRERFMTRARAGESQGGRDSVHEGERPCPRCKTTMQTRDYAGVRLDVCEQCHGMWFDDGEVRMVVDRFRKGAKSGDAELLREIRGGLGEAGAQLYSSLRDVLRH